jgi:hypothetical protein
MNVQTFISASIKEVFIYWSESNVINETFGTNSNLDIGRAVSLEDFNNAVNKAAQQVESGYDKTRVKVTLHNGQEFELRMDITKNETCLATLISRYL